jgi:hypothetical protein
MNTSILNGITPQKTTNRSFLVQASCTTLKNDSMELIFELSPLPTFDFYEPQDLVDVFIPERIITMVNFPPMTIILSRWWCSPHLQLLMKRQKLIRFYLGPKYRFDKFSLAYSTEYTKINDRGWVGFDDASEIIFAGNRNSAK